MTSSRLRVAAVLIAASATILALTSCAPAVTHRSGSGGSGISKPTHTLKPKPTPTPTALAQPASRYPFGCSDVISASAVATLYTTPMGPVDSTQFERLDLDPQIPISEYMKSLGALDCTWYDGTKTNDTSHDMELQVLPVTLAEWNKFAKGGAVQLTNGVDIECSNDENYNTCGYEAFINGSRLSLSINNMKPVPSSNTVLPPAVKAIVAAITAKLASATVGPPPAAQHPSVTLPASGTAMLTVAQARAALGVAASVKIEVDCTGQPDGPWEIMNEAQQQVDNSPDCEFGLPYNGGTQGPYGLYEFIPAGQWAAKQMEGYTPSEVPVSDPSLPAGDSLYQWTDSEGDLNGDLVLGGNLIEINFFKPADTGDPSGSVPLPTALINLANAFETTVRS
jgi:hypothetical protein